MTKNLNSLLKAAAIPVSWWAAATIAMAGWDANPQWHSATFTVDDPVWKSLKILSYGSLVVGTIAGWLVMRQRVQTRMAIILLIPYLALIGAGVVTLMFWAIGLAGGI